MMVKALWFQKRWALLLQLSLMERQSAFKLAQPLN